MGAAICRSNSEAYSAIHSSSFQLRLAYLQDTFWPLYCRAPHTLRCLGRPGNRSYCWPTVGHRVVGRGAHSILNLCCWSSSRLFPNMPCLLRWKGADICGHFHALGLGSQVFSWPNNLSSDGCHWPAALVRPRSLHWCSLCPVRVLHGRRRDQHRAQFPTERNSEHGRKDVPVVDPSCASGCQCDWCKLAGARPIHHSSHVSTDDVSDLPTTKNVLTSRFLHLDVLGRYRKLTCEFRLSRGADDYPSARTS